MNILKEYGIEIKNKSLLETALTHSSYANECHCNDYERLEYLGDAVLEIIISKYFYLKTDLSEGDMSKLRAQFVCEPALAVYSKKIGLDKYIRLGKGQKNISNDAIISDVFESVLGVIYLDQGYEVAEKYVLDVIVPYINNNDNFLADYKSMLQELIQTDKKSIEYVLVNQSGPAHDKLFKVEARVDDLVYGVGIGKSKKEAEQKAAEIAFNKQAS